MQNMNKQLEGLFKNLTESLGDIEGIELGAIPVAELNSENDEEDEEEFNDNPSKIFAGAIRRQFHGERLLLLSAQVRRPL